MEREKVELSKDLMGGRTGKGFRDSWVGGFLFDNISTLFICPEGLLHGVPCDLHVFSDKIWIKGKQQRSSEGYNCKFLNFKNLLHKY